MLIIVANNSKDNVMKRIFSSLLILCTLLICAGCGLTKAVVRNRADGTNTSISIKTSNPTSVSVDPNVTLSVERDTTKLDLR